VAARGDEIPASDTTTVAEAATSLVMSEEDAGDPTALTSLAAGAPSPPPPQMAAATTSAGADDNAVEEPEVIMGHPDLRAPGAVSLSEAMGMTHFMLNQVHDVLRRKREDIN
jgi:hypothetical protein